MHCTQFTLLFECLLCSTVQIIRGGGVLKQFALPVLCELAAASPRTRELLSKYDGVLFYIDLLRESYWQMHAISAIQFWYE